MRRRHGFTSAGGGGEVDASLEGRGVHQDHFAVLERSDGQGLDAGDRRSVAGSGS